MPIQYKNIKNPTLTTSLNIGSHKEFNDNKELISNDKIFSALDLDWEGANIADRELNNTEDLLNLVNYIYENGGQGETIDDIKISSLKVIISAIRALQSEVAKIRNTFRFGINSYTGTDFHMSQTINEIGEDIEENEPLWATEESDLSYIEGFDSQDLINQYFTNEININSETGYIYYDDTLVWEDSDNILKELSDPKEYVYLTSSSKDISFKLLNDDNEELIININDLINYDTVPRKYNILLITSKKINNKGNNFVWLSVSDYSSGESILQGYISLSGKIYTPSPNTPVYLDKTFYLNSIIFLNESEEKSEILYKFDLYSKFQDFTEEVEGTTPKDPEDFKYTTAALTIRSMSTYDLIDSHKNQLQNNELIYCEANKKLYIYSNGKIINIGSGSGSSDDIIDIMTAQEILKALHEIGYISITFKDEDAQDKYAPSNITEYKVNNIALDNVKFINEDTNKVFDIKIDPYGNLKSSEELKNSLAKILETPDGSYLDQVPDDFQSDRTFVGLLNSLRYNKSTKTDMKLYADRVQIAAIYAPLDTDKIYGCTHGYIELANTGAEPFYLDGCYIHYSASDDATSTNARYFRKELKGYIPAGGTYLIRCKKYSDISNKNTFIDVNTYDLEWYVDGELLDLTMSKTGSYNFALTYGTTIGNGTEIDTTTRLYEMYSKNKAKDGAYSKNLISGKQSEGSSRMYAKGYIDAIGIGKKMDGDEGVYWVNTLFDIASNSINKITFELDPAKQAFNSTTTTDSSRIRLDKKGTDYQTVDLNNEYISFPKSDEKKAVADYTPMASYMGKNVITDKTSLDKTKPNAIVCSFGKNPYTTRCFNWLSLGLFDEAVVIIDENNNEYGPFKSYIKADNNDKTAKTQSTNSIHRHEFSNYINNIVYTTSPVSQNTNRITGKFPGNNEFYASHKCIIDFKEVDSPKKYKYYITRLDSCGKKDNSYKSEIREFTLYPKTYQAKIYQITDQQGFHWIEYQVWAAAAKKLNEVINNDIKEYRQYTQQEVNEYNAQLEGAVSTNMINSNTGVNYTQEEVNEFNSKLDGAISTNDYNIFYKGIMPIIVNTGDAVQSGARVNEWVDYFNAGDYLFKHYEQMNIVGNNDLCDTDVEALGTGDDTGKSNGYFFHLFNCYEVDDYKNDDNEENDVLLPICNDIYIPSLYYMDCILHNDNNNEKTLRLLFVNSEITAINCRDWFNLKVYNSDNTINKDATINIYTGFTCGISAKATQEWKGDTFTPIYNILYSWTNDQNKDYIPFCHEMPFTVITNACLAWHDKDNIQIGNYRSLSDAASPALIGSHLNQLTKVEDGKGMHWFSRLLEYRNIKVCLGGHKHTYACTYPLRENYIYTIDNTTKYSLTDGPMSMSSTLENDTAAWKINGKNLSKFPIAKRPKEYINNDNVSEIEQFNIADNVSFDIKVSSEPNRFWPLVDEPVDHPDYSKVSYLMSQATGYKLTSNKELPSEIQKFAMILPKTTIDKNSDSASADQKFPMFTSLDLSLKEDNMSFKYKVGRFNNIFNGSYKFTQTAYSSDPIEVQYLVQNTNNNFGSWITVENNVIIQKSKDNILDYLIKEDTEDENHNTIHHNILYPELVDNNNQYLYSN